MAMALQWIRMAGIEILSRHMGITGMIRFLQQVETGVGDYTEERNDLPGNPLIEDLAAKIQASKYNVKHNP